MAYPSISTALTAQRSAGISKLYVKTASELWQSLGYIRNGELKVTPYSTEDTHKRNHAHSYTVEAKVELLQTGVGNVELIDKLTDGTCSYLFQLTDSASITSGATEGWVTVSNSQVGCSAKFVSDGNPSTNQFIELTIKGSVSASSINDIVKASIATADFYIGTGTGTFSVFATQASTPVAGTNYGVKTDIRPNGFSSVGLKLSTDGSYTTIGRVRNGKITCDFISEEDSLGRPNVYGVDIDVEYEYLVTDSASLLLLNEVNETNTDIQITLLDAKVITIASKSGVSCAFENIGDFDKMRVLKFSHKGRILTSEFDGIVA